MRRAPLVGGQGTSDQRISLCLGFGSDSPGTLNPGLIPKRYSQRDAYTSLAFLIATTDDGDSVSYQHKSGSEFLYLKRKEL